MNFGSFFNTFLIVDASTQIQNNRFGPRRCSILVLEGAVFWSSKVHYFSHSFLSNTRSCTDITYNTFPTFQGNIVKENMEHFGNMKLGIEDVFNDLYRGLEGKKASLYCGGRPLTLSFLLVEISGSNLKPNQAMLIYNHVPSCFIQFTLSLIFNNKVSYSLSLSKTI